MSVTITSPKPELDKHLVSLSRPSSWEAERYRNVRRTLERGYTLEKRRVIGVTSAEAGEGKSTTAVNLAAVFAEIPGYRVLLVDADFRCSSVTRMVGPDASRPDLTAAIADEKSLLENIVCPAHSGPHDLPFAVVRTNPQTASAHRIVESAHLGQLMAAARRQYDCVIVDCPPLLWVADCKALSRWIDGFLLIVAAGQTRRDRLSDAISLVDAGKILGLVLNRDGEPPWRGSHRYYLPYGPRR